MDKKTMEDIQKQVEELNETPKPLTEDQIRSEVIEKFGLSEDDNSELIDKLVEDKVIESKKFSTAISQKINWRTKAKELETQFKPEPKPEVKDTITTKNEVFDENKIVEVLEKRDLEALDMSDELKKEVSTYAKLKKVTIKQAQNSDYIKFLVLQDEKKEKIDNASLGSNRKPVSKKDYGEMKATDFDMTSPEGKADFAKYKDEMRKKLG
jgi:hypothetical protein